ncbi:MAG TPA: hypothetical protein VFW45_15255 [Candidatus Polarisedimenticolia bacterium]|nr:hypothetical protein [Candidatus Polarisedimenticolia bacterium]
MRPKTALPSDLEKLFGIVRDHLGLRVKGIHARFLRKAYVRRASVERCNARCCLGGTTVCETERDRVLSHARIVSEAMTSRARGDSARWFGLRLSKDPDFASGRSTFTRVLDGACVFLRDDGGCALHVAGERHLGHPYALKPSVCLLWPLAVNKGKLEVGFANLTHRRACCAPVRRGGRRTILEVVGSHAERICEMEQIGLSRGGTRDESPSPRED